MNITEFDIFNIQQFIDRFDKLSETNFKEEVLKYLDDSRMDKNDFLTYHYDIINSLKDNKSKIINNYITEIHRILNILK
jgi:spore coat protein CotH